MLSADGTKLYVNNEAASTLTVFDTKTLLADAVIPGFAQPRQGVKLSPDGKTVFVTNFLGDKITLVDTATNKITGEIVGSKSCAPSRSPRTARRCLPPTAAATPSAWSMSPPARSPLKSRWARTPMGPR